MVPEEDSISSKVSNLMKYLSYKAFRASPHFGPQVASL